MAKSISERWRVGLLAGGLFALNATLWWPLFRTGYLDDFQSNEGSFIAIARFLSLHWPHVAWLPWFNGGTPIEDAYFILVPAVTALIAAIGRCSFAHAFHLLSALSLSLGPSFLFVFAWYVSGWLRPAMGSALLWSLASPAALFPHLRPGPHFLLGLARLKTTVFYGESPHNIALSLLPLVWLAVAMFWRVPTPRRFAAATLLVAAEMLSNAFGMAVVTASVVLLFFSIPGAKRQRAILTCSMFAAAYLFICRCLPPWLLLETMRNSATIGGDYRSGWWAAMLIAPVALLIVMLLRVGSPMVRFACVFTFFFCAVVAAWYLWGLALLPSPHRYLLECEAGLSLLLSFGLYPFWRRARLRRLWLFSAPAFGFLFLMDFKYAQGMIQPAELERSAPYREAKWLTQNLPGERVMASGDTAFWLDVFGDNPQMAAGHEAAANWVLRVATYTIYTGQNAGADDGPISVLWLKAFGCGAITVPGPASKDYAHPLLRPEKFVGLMPWIWKEGDDSIYGVPRRSQSIAHVLPREALVSQKPANGLDVDQLKRYVQGLDSERLPGVSLGWYNPTRGLIRASMRSGELISLQMTYDSGWAAFVQGRRLTVRSDGLGMMVIDPECAGDCAIELDYTGGAGREWCAGIGLLTGCLLVMCAVLPPQWWPHEH